VLADPAFAAELEILRGGNSADNALAVRNNAREYVSQGVQSVLGLQFGALAAAHALEVGARYHRDSEDRFQHEDAYRMQDGRMVLTTAGAPGSQDNRIGEARALALFVEDRITHGRWTFSPGRTLREHRLHELDRVREGRCDARGARERRRKRRTGLGARHRRDAADRLGTAQSSPACTAASARPDPVPTTRRAPSRV
jgi:Fe(3+) dicitrate transport protein